MTTSLSLPEADGYGKETLQKIHKNLNADMVVVGSYVFLGGGQVRLDLRLQDALQGVTLASVSEKGREDQIDELVAKAGAPFREKLGVGAISLAESAEVRDSLPTTTEATRLYAGRGRKIAGVRQRGGAKLASEGSPGRSESRYGTLSPVCCLFGPWLR